MKCCAEINSIFAVSSPISFIVQDWSLFACWTLNKNKSFLNMSSKFFGWSNWHEDENMSGWVPSNTACLWRSCGNILIFCIGLTLLLGRTALSFKMSLKTYSKELNIYFTVYSCYFYLHSAWMIQGSGWNWKYNTMQFLYSTMTECLLSTVWADTRSCRHLICLPLHNLLLNRRN